MTNHTRRPMAEYVSLLAQRDEQGLTFSELSAVSGVPIATLQYWSRKLRKPDAVESADANDGAFLEVGLSASSDAAIEIVMNGDIRIAVQPGFDPTTLRAVVEALAC